MKSKKIKCEECGNVVEVDYLWHNPYCPNCDMKYSKLSNLKASKIDGVEFIKKKNEA